MSYWVINEAIAAIYRRYNHKPQTERGVLISTILNLVADAKSNIIVVSINQNSIKETIFLNIIFVPVMHYIYVLRINSVVIILSLLITTL